MATWKEALIDYIRAKTANGKTYFGNIAAYYKIYFLSDFTSDDDIPNLRAVKALLGAYGGGVMVPVAALTNKTIDWQADTPPGFSDTYANIFGNMMPKPDLYINTGGHTYVGTNYTPTAVRSADETQLLTFTLDWGFSGDGYIQF